MSTFFLYRLGTSTFSAVSTASALYALSRIGIWNYPASYTIQQTSVFPPSFAFKHGSNGHSNNKVEGGGMGVDVVGSAEDLSLLLPAILIPCAVLILLLLCCMYMSRVRARKLQLQAMEVLREHLSMPLEGTYYYLFTSFSISLYLEC